MHIKLSKADLDLFTSIKVNKEYNIAIADLFNNLCFIGDESLSEYFKSHSHKLSDQFIASTILSSIEDEDKQSLYPYFANSFHLANEKEYIANPYYQLIKPLKISYQGVKLETLYYEPYTFFPLDEISLIDSYKEISYLGLFKSSYPYLALTENNNIWMCITPNEINTMSPYIQEAKGNVITFGLGLGYYAFMVSNKPEVNKVTIVEQDKRIIEVFKEYLLPHFPHKDKIEIIQDEAISFLKSYDMKIYDYVYFDLWHNPNDGLPLYLEIIPLEVKKYHYWLEKSIIALIRRYMITLIEEQLDGLDESNYIKATNEDDKIINLLYKKTKDIEIKSYQDLYNLLSDNSLRNLIK